MKNVIIHVVIQHEALRLRGQLHRSSTYIVRITYLHVHMYMILFSSTCCSCRGRLSLLCKHAAVQNWRISWRTGAHAGRIENDTPQMLPCFAHHNIIQKKIISAQNFCLMIFYIDFDLKSNFSVFEGI